MRMGPRRAGGGAFHKWFMSSWLTIIFAIKVAFQLSNLVPINHAPWKLSYPGVWQIVTWLDIIWRWIDRLFKIDNVKYIVRLPNSLEHRHPFETFHGLGKIFKTIRHLREKFWDNKSSHDLNLRRVTCPCALLQRPNLAALTIWN